MVDLETAAAGVPIISTAAGKLRSVSGNSQRFGDTDGLVDAFAEVFAQMAIAAPPPAQPPEPSPTQEDDELAQADASETSETSEHSTADDDQYSQQTSLTDNQPNPVTAITAEPETKLAEDPFNELDSKQGDPGEQVAEPEKVTEDIDFATPQADAQAIEEDLVDDEIESEIDLTVEATAVASASGPTNRRRESESNQVARDDSGNQPTAATDKQKVDRKTAPVEQSPTDQQPETEGKRPTIEPAEKTSRQEFLDQRRSNPRESDPSDQPASESASMRRISDGATSVGAAGEPLSRLDSTPTVPASINRATSNPIPIVDARASAGQNIAAKSNTQSSGGHTDARTASTPQRSETQNRLDSSVRRETQPTKNSVTDTTARVKLVQRVSRAFQHLGPEGGVVRLKLAPAELGSVRVEMQIKQRKVQARVVAETEAASKALREHLPDLKARLESFGMQVEQLTVETETDDQHSGLPFDRQSQQDQSRERQPRRPLAAVKPNIDAPTHSNTLHELPVNPAGVTSGVDLRI